MRIHANKIINIALKNTRGLTNSKTLFKKGQQSLKNSFKSVKATCSIKIFKKPHALSNSLKGHLTNLEVTEPVEGNERNFEKLLPHEIQRFLDLLRGLGLLHPGGAHVLREVGLLGHRLPNR